MILTLKKSTLIKLGFLLLIICLYLFVPQVNTTVKKLVVLFSMLDISTMKEYIKSFGAWAPVVSLVLMMFQSIAAPLPAFIITFANAWLFGWFFGAILSWSGAMLGAILCYYISKLYGRPAAEKFVGKKALDISDKFFNKYGPYAILIARLLPFISFDAVSYAAGLTSISLWSFLWSTGIGQLPATIVYSVLGQNIDKASKLGLWVICGVAALIAFALAVKKYIDEKHKNKQNF
ncbi:TVP38/TMEM64 family protein [Clostridium sp. YIM B02515]|uniref:TVP38/TMEM64 family membrane protein n=1 Tax=Clostridium rhizosphaerae TaxID=2803861 RepID=A0ABS1T597_9CLOT|nr:TVP38/TMEM64 family protein [Clostridium rhizosphaerae]